MATETLRPNGAGNETNISIYAPNTGEANWEDVDEETADDSTSCLRNFGTSYARDLYALPNHSSGSGVINSVTVHFRWRTTYYTSGSYTSYARAAIRTHSATYDGSEKSSTASATWIDSAEAYNTNPYTGSAWTWDEIDAMEIGASVTTDSESQAAFLTQVYVVIDYTPVTEKTSSETGSGSEAVGSRLLEVVEEGEGAENLLARLLAGIESAAGLDAGGLLFTSSDLGSGLDAILALEARLTGADSGSGVDMASLTKALLAADSGLGADAAAALLAKIVAGELVVGSDCFVAKVELTPKGGGMRLPPDGKTSIPSRRVNL
jgi:hypothetical protein